MMLHTDITHKGNNNTFISINDDIALVTLLPKWYVFAHSVGIMCK